MRELLFSVTKDDFDIQTFRCGGHGGQNINKLETGVRIVHKESGAVGECREERKQGQNKKKAFLRCIESPVFKAWHKKKCAEVMLSKDQRKALEQRVDEMLTEANLEIEYYNPEEIDGNTIHQGKKRKRR